VQKITFSFLILHREFQDTITYEVDPTFTFEDVINHICSSFDFDPSKVSLSSNLGMKIDNLSGTVEEIATTYGMYFKLVVDLPAVALSDPVVRDSVVGQSVEADIETTREAQFEDWHAVESSSYLPVEEVTYPAPRGTAGEVPSGDVIAIDTNEADRTPIVEEFVNQVLEIAYDRKYIDDDGLMEITVLPQINTYISQLKVKFDPDRAAKELFTKVSVTCGYLPREVLVVPLNRNPSVLRDLEPSVHDLIRTHGPAFLLFSTEQRTRIETDPQFLSTVIHQLLSTAS